VAIYFIFTLKKDIFYIPVRKRKISKKAPKTNIFQAFLEEDITSSTGNFLFLPKLEIE
jgi:hypothetical protein